MSAAFRAAVEARDIEAMTDCLADDVAFNSPVAFKPFNGRDEVAGVLRAVMETFEAFEYTDEFDAEGKHALVFRAKVGDKSVEGLDLLRYDEDGRIADFTVMLRPLSGLIAMAEAMGPKVAALKA